MCIKGEGYAQHPHPVALVGAAASGVALDTHRRQSRSETSLLVGLGFLGHDQETDWVKDYCRIG